MIAIKIAANTKSTMMETVSAPAPAAAEPNMSLPMTEFLFCS